MKLLVLNSGSSTLKFDLFDTAKGNQPAPQIARIAHGVVERIGGDAALELRSSLPNFPENIERRSVDAPAHNEAASIALDALLKLADGKIDAVGHRVVHGGDRFVLPTLIDDYVIASIDDLSELAPLHNPQALAGIKVARTALGPAVPMVAVFDTAFHSKLPDYAYTYALPYEMAERHKVRRYGFHGIAHESMLQSYARLKGVDLVQPRLITLQLGNGCSAAAIRHGRSVDTSMGFTPLEGLVMGTRSGDVDASIIAYLAEKEGVQVTEVEEWLNKRSGLLGISGTTGDMRTLLASVEKGDKHAELAVQVFCYRVRKYIGAYLSAVDGADAIIFGGGIGENAPSIRGRILKGMEWCDVQLDPTRNEAAVGKEGQISADGSTIGVYVLPVDESLLIAQQSIATAGLV